MINFTKSSAQNWQRREKQLLEENRRLCEKVTSTLSERDYEVLQSKLNHANETVDDLKSNFSRVTEEWKKKEMKLIDDRNQLRYKLQNSPKMLPIDLERLQEQLKDSQEMNVKLKFDLDSYKDKCNTLENLCTDLKKVIMDEEIAERVYANDNIPASVKQFLSSSSSSVINTLTQMFGCLSRGASRNRQSYSGHKDVMVRKNDLFTTSESLMINDLTKSFDQSDLIRELIKEKDQIKRENLDLNRQVKELEQIVRRRAHPNFSNVSEIIRSGESKMYEKESETIKNLKRELLEKQHVIIDLKNQLVQAKVGYDQNLLAMQGKLVNIQEENIKLKEEVDKKKIVVGGHGPKCRRKGRSCDPPPVTTRNFRTELISKEKEIQHLSKQLDDVKKMNKKLIKAKENYYLSSKEQSADSIQLNKKYISLLNNEVREKSSYVVNNSTIQKEQPEVDTPDVPFANPNRNYDIHDLKNENELLNGNENHLETARTNPKSDTTTISCDSITNGNSNNYRQLSDRINLLESKNQNLPQLTGDLLELLSKGELGDKLFQNQTSDKSEVQYQDELNKFVTAFVMALKNVSN